MTSRFTKSVAAAVTAASLLLCAGAAAAADELTIRDELMKTTGLRADSVRPSPIPGIWELIIQDRIFYVDDKVEYVISGTIIDTKTKTNQTAKRAREWARENWSRWPRQDAVKQVIGNGEREVIVFSDANCTYCRSMERVFERVGNLTVYTFITPMIRGEQNNREIVCSKNPSKAWVDWMRKGITPPEAPADCDASVMQRNLSLAGRYNITGAPTFFFPSGERMTGAVSADQFEEILRDVQ
ncbi:DsbC family protein [Sutterella sp.]|uniref:DsbC family protein n=1 Tax=Sutterella sp. TaxID=1981025 RepID=UPI0026E0CE91|nr:DsbC family protein [Sutterella sp.]MDO5532660.1 DsbC family protein [Sutterella sp.]